jgi:hypothetical protein
MADLAPWIELQGRHGRELQPATSDVCSLEAVR